MQLSYLEIMLIAVVLFRILISGDIRFRPLKKLLEHFEINVEVLDFVMLTFQLTLLLLII